jgi:hypothetical protein
MISGSPERKTNKKEKSQGAFAIPGEFFYSFSGNRVDGLNGCGPQSLPMNWR